MQMQIQTILISQIIPAPYNPRIDFKSGDKPFDQLCRSIQHFGFVEPLVWNKRTGHTVGGHLRAKVLQHLGHTDVQVVVVDLPLEQEKALNIALNKITGEWDEPKLADILQEIAQMPDVDIELTGFGSDDLRDLLTRLLDENGQSGNDDEFDPDAALDESRPAITQAGELIELGAHRLLCGDSTNPEQVRMLMDGKRATLFATDPPYLVSYTGLNHPGKSRAIEKRKNKSWSGSYGITWDDADANPDLYDKFIGVAIAEAILPEAAWYCWHASRRQMMVETVLIKHGAFVHQQIIWVKDRPILNRSWYTWQHEPCFFGWIKSQKPPRAADDYPSTTWQVPTVKAGERTDHPTSKPVELFRVPMRQHTRVGEICFEPFCGSGSQLIAAEQLGRRCFAIEISRHYCDVIVRRWMHLMGVNRVSPELAQRFALPQAPETEVAA